MEKFTSPSRTGDRVAFPSGARAKLFSPSRLEVVRRPSGGDVRMRAVGSLPGKSRLPERSGSIAWSRAYVDSRSPDSCLRGPKPQDLESLETQVPRKAWLLSCRRIDPGRSSPGRSKWQSLGDLPGADSRQAPLEWLSFQALIGGTLPQLSLERATVDSETAGGLRNVSATVGQDAVNVLPFGPR
jgi:hypothetical protein